MKNQQMLSQENLNKKVEQKMYIEYKTLRQEAAEAISIFSNYFSNKKNVEQAQELACAIIEDLSKNAKTINKTKKSGVGYGVVALFFPSTVEVIKKKKTTK